MYETKILIAGAGPTGLTLALELARRKVPLRLIEARDTPCDGSRGKGIQPRTLEIFDSLELIDSISACGGPYPRLRIHAGPFSARAGSLGSSKPASESRPYPALLMVSQAQTEAILRRRLTELGAGVEFGKALIGFTQNEYGVSSEISNGETVRADFMVGTDGGHSAVRKLLGLRLIGEKIDEKMLVADVEIDGLDRSDWHIWPFVKSGPVGLCPLPHTSLFQMTCKAIAASDSIEETVRRVTGHRVQRIGWQSLYEPSVRMVDRYRIGRVLLAGDAAHIHPPAGGQGLNTGVQDAYNLGWKLAGVVRGAPDSLLDSYETERLPIAAEVLGLSRKLHRLRSMKRGDATNQLGVNYRNSPLSSGVPLGSLRPGDRMPDARLRDGSRLFDHLRIGCATELATAEGPRILIRPDGYIAKISSASTEYYFGEAVRRIPERIAAK